MIVILVGYITLSYMGKTEFIWGGYKSFKFLSFFMPVILVCGLLIFQSVKMKFDDLPNNIMTGIFFSIVLINCLSGLYFIKKSAIFPSMIVNRDMVALDTISKNPKIESVNILGDNWWELMWQSYFLMNKKTLS